MDGATIRFVLEDGSGPGNTDSPTPPPLPSDGGKGKPAPPHVGPGDAADAPPAAKKGGPASDAPGVAPGEEQGPAPAARGEILQLQREMLKFLGHLPGIGRALDLASPLLGNQFVSGAITDALAATVNWLRGVEPGQAEQSKPTVAVPEPIEPADPVQPSPPVEDQPPTRSVPESDQPQAPRKPDPNPEPPPASAGQAPEPATPAGDEKPPAAPGGAKSIADAAEQIASGIAERLQREQPAPGEASAATEPIREPSASPAAAPLDSAAPPKKPEVAPREPVAPRKAAQETDLGPTGRQPQIAEGRGTEVHHMPPFGQPPKEQAKPTEPPVAPGKAAPPPPPPPPVGPGAAAGAAALAPALPAATGATASAGGVAAGGAAAGGGALAAGLSLPVVGLVVAAGSAIVLGFKAVAGAAEALANELNRSVEELSPFNAALAAARANQQARDLLARKESADFLGERLATFTDNRAELKRAMDRVGDAIEGAALDRINPYMEFLANLAEKGQENQRSILERIFGALLDHVVPGEKAVRSLVEIVNGYISAKDKQPNDLLRSIFAHEEPLSVDYNGRTYGGNGGGGRVVKLPTDFAGGEPALGL